MRISSGFFFGIALADHACGLMSVFCLSQTKARRSVSIEGILSSGLSAVLTNSAALKVTSDNISNVNTDGYHRRVTQTSTQVAGSDLTGVTASDVTRVVDKNLDSQTRQATSSSSQYAASSQVLSQLDGALGQPGDGTSILSKLDDLYSTLGQVSLDPSSYANQQSLLSNLQSLTQSVSSLADSVTQLRQSTDSQVASDVTDANTLIKQIYDVNQKIQQAQIGGDSSSSSGLSDTRDQLVNQLSKLVDIKTVDQSDGRQSITTTDGTTLVGDMYAQLNYSAGGNDTYSPITIQMVQGSTGQLLGSAQAFDSHVSGGELRGLLDARDGELLDVGNELGSLTQSLSLSLNQIHNASSSVPPPTSMTGRDTGLLSDDSLNFTGATTIGITDSNGNLQHRVDIDFDAGTISVDDGTATSIGTTIGSSTDALNAALGSNSTATFQDGVLSVSANSGNGLVISDDNSNPSERGGVGFSQFFGLNDLVTADASSITTTGLSSTDAHGLASGGSISLNLQGPDGERTNTVNVSVTGSTIGDMVDALNSAFSGKATFSLDDSGKLSMTTASGYQGYTLNVLSDSTQRGTTGTSFSQLFGIGTTQSLSLARGFSVTSAVSSSPAKLALAQADLDSSTALGTKVVSSGDNRGALALQGVKDNSYSFAVAGSLGARNTSFSDYISTFYQDVGTRASNASDQKSSADSWLSEAQSRQGSTEGVNLDEELSNMMSLQQAYNAGARLIKTAQDLFDELMKIV
jgi:flagellar hook-associated protein 1 FlgK